MSAPADDDSLARALGAAPPASVAALDPGARARLAAVLRGATERQSRSIDDAFTAALKQVPFPMRGLVRKALLG